MEAGSLNNSHFPGSLHRLLTAAAPVLLISIGYVDPGKWAAVVDGGARFGLDLVALMLVFNFASILCQYLSARIGVVTGKDLAKICSDEYDKFTCIILGVQTEVSMIALDLTMILGTAHWLNLLFGLDLLTCVILTAIDAILFPLFAIPLDHFRAKLLCICIAGIILFSSILGVLISQPETQFSMNGMLAKLSGERAFALMSLLGANIMPHNFYLHSAIVQQHHGPPNVSKDSLCLDHFFAILCVYSGIYLVYYVLMNSAANMFYSTGLVLLTFQDAMSLMEQAFRSPIVPFAFVLVLIFSSQITALTSNLGGQLVLRDFFRLEIPGWLHRATIRIIAIIPAFFCVWTSGAEGMYQLLIFTQVMVALLLPSSVIPLFRVASSRPIMGIYKVSQIEEFFALITFIGMLGVNIIFLVEMIFGNSDWVGNLRWNMGSSMSAPYVVFLITACASLCSMLWLAATPLKSASFQLDAQIWNWDIQNSVYGTSTEREETDLSEIRNHGKLHVQKPEPLLPQEKPLESQSDISHENFDLDLPDTIFESDPELHKTPVEENHSTFSFPTPIICTPEDSASMVKPVPVSNAVDEVSDDKFPDSRIVKIELMDPVEKTLEVEGEKDDDEGDNWEPEESSRGVTESSSSMASEGPGSFRSFSGKSDEGGNGPGSLSRLAGLGRAARRQLALILDEFWGQLFDFHGQATQEAKAKKLDVLLGADSKPVVSSLKVDASGKEFTGYFPSLGGRGSDSFPNSSLIDSPKQQQQGPSSIESSYGGQKGSSSMWSSNHMQLLDVYVQNSSRNVPDSGERRYSSLRVPDSGERRYSSLRVPQSSDGWDNQPATVHGYQIKSYLNQIAKDRSPDSLYGHIESPAPKSPSLASVNYRDSLAYALGQKMQNGISSVQASSFKNFPLSRNSTVQSERPNYDGFSSGPADNLAMSANTKKYHSLPDISGLAVPHRDLYVSNKNVQWDSPAGFGSSVGRSGFGSSIGRTSYEPSLYPNTGLRAGAPPFVSDELSTSNLYKDSFSFQSSSGLDTESLWSRQPFEQFVVADKGRTIGSGVGSKSNSIAREAALVVDWEAKLLQSFRHSIVRLLKLEGSDWLFRQNDGADEDLIDLVATRERFLYEAEAKEMNRAVQMGESNHLSPERKSLSTLRNDEAGFSNFSLVPHCGEGCIWRTELIISFGVWCIHRILDLSVVESRPELWGKYTYVLNRLQGIIDLAFSKPRTPSVPCFCIQIPVAQQQRSSSPVSDGMLPPAAKTGRGKCTTAAILLDTIKEVETAVSCRKGRTGTAAGDVAFPKGKENLASVLKRYKRRLTTKQVGALEGSSSRKGIQQSTSYGL